MKPGVEEILKIKDQKSKSQIKYQRKNRRIDDLCFHFEINN